MKRYKIGFIGNKDYDELISADNIPDAIRKYAKSRGIIKYGKNSPTTVNEKILYSRITHKR